MAIESLTAAQRALATSSAASGAATIATPAPAPAAPLGDPATLAAIAASNAALLSGVTQADLQAKKVAAQAASQQQQQLSANAALAITTGATFNKTTGILGAPGSAPGSAGSATGPTGPASTTGPTGTTGTTGSTALQSAANSLQAILESYGLTGGIAAGVTAMLQNGLDITTIQTILDSPDPMGAVKGLGLSPTQLSAATDLVSSWQTRFVGNQARIAAGLNPLDPATYIANEQSYKQVMTMAGIPASSPLQSTAYLGQLMGTDVSPSEVQMRVNTATAAIQNEDPQVLAQLQSQYGLSLSTIATHLLDPTVAAPLVQQEYNAATIGAEAARAGTNIVFGVTGPLSAMGLAAQGITQAQAAAGFQNIASQQPAMQSLAGRYQGYGNAGGVGQQLEASTFSTSGAAAAQANLERLKTQEVATFSGSAGAATGSLGMKDISGLS